MMRPEGRAIDWGSLQEYQQRAVRRIVAMLREAVDRLDEQCGTGEGCRSRSPLGDRNRMSRSFFLSGEPGSGKTSVYVSLRDFFEKKALPSEELRADWLKVVERVTWLEPLDLEPYPEHVNFLAAVLVRIETAMQASGSGPERAGVLERYRDRGDPLQALQTLQQQVALAWDGNVPARGPQLDPDEYANEVVRAERSRLELNRRIYDALDGLSRMPQSSRRQLFVLPVDDLYLKPDTSLQFLRLLRMITVPHLFILLMGDYDVLEELFYQDMLGKLVRLAGNGALRALTKQQRELPARARQLTAHAMHKLLPPAQRFVLEAPHTPNYEFKPVGVARTLEAQLEQMAFTNEPEPDEPGTWPWTPVSNGSRTTLKDLLMSSWLNGSGERTTEEFYWYSGMDIWDSSPRHLVDLWFRIEGKLAARQGRDDERFTPTDDIIDLVFNRALEMLAEQNYLTEEQRHKFEYVLERHGQYVPKPRLDTSKLRMRLECERHGRADGNAEPADPYGRVRWGWGRTWVFELASAEEDKNAREEDKNARDLTDGTPHLPPRPKAWFIVLHDILASMERLRGGSLIESFIDRLCGQYQKVRPSQNEDQRDPPDGLDWYALTFCKERWLPWPVPRWKHVWDLDEFGYRWGQVVKQYRRKPPTTDVLEREWIKIICGMLRYPDEPNYPTTWQDVPTYLEDKQDQGDRGWKAMVDEFLTALNNSGQNDDATTSE